MLKTIRFGNPNLEPLKNCFVLFLQWLLFNGEILQPFKQPVNIYRELGTYKKHV